MKSVPENITDNQSPSRRNDPSPIIESVRESVRKKIEAINSASERERADIDAAIHREIEEYRGEQQEVFDGTISSEGGKIRNLSAIAMKKQKLEGIESFIKKILSEASGSIRKDPRYADFLTACVTSALKNIKSGSASILISAEDMPLSTALGEGINKAGFSISFTISPDERVRMGGAMVIDDSAEVIYNNSVERIFYRKNDEIRREIVRSLKESGEYVDG